MVSVSLSSTRTRVSGAGQLINFAPYPGHLIDMRIRFICFLFAPTRFPFVAVASTLHIQGLAHILLNRDKYNENRHQCPGFRGLLTRVRVLASSCGFRWARNQYHVSRLVNLSYPPASARLRMLRLNQDEMSLPLQEYCAQTPQQWPSTS